ncbi:MAG: L-seryl-tRNA(Sec) selenium transferase [Thermoanaerobaculia bacterium]
MTRATVSDPRRALPAVDRLLDDRRVEPLAAQYGREAVRNALRAVLEDARVAIAGGLSFEIDTEALLARVERRLAGTLGARLRPVLNATGVFLHTNLGRAPLPREVAAETAELAAGYCDLELDLATGKRGERNRRARALLAALTGAEDALVVNNNAAALVLALATFAAGRGVVVSRGELVEIGGSFRIPEILAASGARLVEVGTTNRTRLADYADALGERTALMLKVQPSNFRQSGFVEAVEPAALAELAHRHGLVLLVDQGSGLLRRHPAPQLAGYAAADELLAAGCDLVAGSGDKLLGGPQAGLLLGRRDAVERCRRNPLYRALRPDRTTYAALEAVLRVHLAGAPLPVDRLWPDAEAHRRRLEGVAAELGATIEPADAFLGGGSAPEQAIPGEALSLPGDDALARRLRQGEPPVMGYLRRGRLVLDLRTVPPEQDATLVRAVRAALETAGSGS